MAEVMDGSTLLHWKPNPQPEPICGPENKELVRLLYISVSMCCSHQDSLLAGVIVSATSEVLQGFRLALVSISP